MATLASIATGNFTSSSTWAVCDATAELDSQANNTQLTTSNVASSAFAPGAITIDAYAVKLAVRATPSGTLTVELYNSTDAVIVATTTIDVADIQMGPGVSAATGGIGWYFFYCGSITLLAGKNYTIRARTSVSSQVTLYRNATAGNWSRQLRTTTTQAPAASDKLLIQGQWTAAATSSSYTVTMNNTATTAFGELVISNKGTLTFDTAASTNYYLKVNQTTVHPSGVYNIGTAATPIPSTSTATHECNSASAAQYGILTLGNPTFTAQGNPKAVVKTLMTADKVAGNTVITVASTSGWAVGDELAFASTTRTASECEKKTILTVDSATQVTLSAGLTNDHSGTSPTQAEVINLTRNVVIKGASAANTGYLHFRGDTDLDLDYVAFTNMGSSVSTTKGMSFSTTTGTQRVSYCSFYDNTVASNCGVEITATSTNSPTIEYCVFYNQAGAFVETVANTGTAVFDYNTGIRSTGAQGFLLNDVGCAVTNNTVAGCGNIGFSLNESAGTLGTFSGNTAHSGGNRGFHFSAGLFSGTISNLSAWRNSSEGMLLGALPTTSEINVTFDGGTFFGNNTANVIISNRSSGSLVFKNYTLNAGTTLTCPIGMSLSTLHLDSLSLESCSFGATTTHSTGDILLGSQFFTTVNCYNCTFSSSTTISGQSDMPRNLLSYKGIWSMNHNGVAGSVRSYQRYGTITLDTTLSNTASPSVRITPSNASNKQQFCSKFIPVASGATATVSVYIRKSVVGDGAAYNGNQPRLMVRKNLVAGITSDTVIATATNAANGAWELQTGSSAAVSADCVLEFFVDCDGTAGWINVDDFTTTASADPTGMKYWIYGQPVVGNSSSGGGAAGGSFTFS